MLLYIGFIFQPYHAGQRMKRLASQATIALMYRLYIQNFFHESSKSCADLLSSAAKVGIKILACLLPCRDSVIWVVISVIRVMCLKDKKTCSGFLMIKYAARLFVFGFSYLSLHLEK